MSSVTVREARPEDVQAVVTLADCGWRAAYEEREVELFGQAVTDSLFRGSSD